MAPKEPLLFTHILWTPVSTAACRLCCDHFFHHEPLANDRAEQAVAARGHAVGSNFRATRRFREPGTRFAGTRATVTNERRRRVRLFVEEA